VLILFPHMLSNSFHEAAATVIVTETATETVAASTSSGAANKQAAAGTAGIFLSALVAVLQL